MADEAVLIVMGVSGSGKTTIGKLLAQKLGWQFADADDFHPQANIQKMQAGIPLDDADRAPWLAAIKAWIDKILRSGEHGIVTCSVLKQSYRSFLLAGQPHVIVVYLKGSPALIRQRMEHREGHFMPAALLQSQIDTLEEPKEDEQTIIVSIEPSPERIVQNLLDKLAGRTSN